MELKTCYLVAAPGTDLGAIQQALDARGIQILVPSSAEVEGGGIGSEVLRADLVVGVLTKSPQSHWVLFELGQAAALRKRVVLVIPPIAAIAPPPQLRGILTIRASLSNREAFDFALDQIALAPSTSKAPNVRHVPPRRGLSDQEASSFRARLPQLARDTAGLERFVRELLTAGGADLAVETKATGGADIAVWSDALQSVLGNPILIEVKQNLPDKTSMQKAAERLSKAAIRAGFLWSLLVYVSAHGVARGPGRTPPNVLVIQLDDLIAKLERQPFTDVLLELRNEKVHGRRK